MRKSEEETEYRCISVRVPAKLYESIEKDAATLQISIADCSRLRLRSGRVPQFESE